MTTIGEPPATADAGTRPSTVELQAVSTLGLDVHPSMATGRRNGQFVVAVENRGRAPVEARLSVELGDGRLRAAVMPALVSLRPGERIVAQVVLRARRPQLLRREVQHTAKVRVRGSQSGAAVSRGLVFLQARVLSPWWLALLVALVAGAIVSAGQLPDRVAVPTVEGGLDAASAERALRAAGLTMDPRIRSRTAPGVRPGTILDQIPDPGARVARGAPVTLLVAIGERRTVTPALAGRTAARAAAILRAAGLTAGPVLPAGAPATAVVDSQLPAAGRRVPSGTAVTVFVRARRASDGPAPAAPAAKGGGTATVPKIDGRGTDAYARAVAAARLVPKVIRAVDPRAPGTLIGVRPKAGTKLGSGERVRLVVSAGVPRLAFDTGAVVRVFDPRSGRTEREASPPQGDAVEPSWTPDGRRVLYRVGTRLVLASARLADRGRVLYDRQRTKYTSATIAPAPSGDVVALVRRSGGNGDLCFARIGTSQLRPRCIADRRWDLGRQISWRRDGRALLVFGVRRNRPGTFGILEYRTTRPFSTNPAHWRGAVATDTSVRGRGVIAASYSPSGRDVALVTNIGLPRFQLLLTRAGDLRDPAARALPVRACEVAWRPDGEELAVVQSDAACSRPLGAVVRVNPRRPRATVTVSNGGRHPAYQPLTYAGPKGVS